MSLSCFSFNCFLLSILVVRRVHDSTVAARLQKKLSGQPQEKPYPHGDRKRPPDPTAPPSPLLYTSLATAASSWAWGLRTHMATARAHPTPPRHPRHYYTRVWRPQPLHGRGDCEPTWRPQGPTRPHRATLATTIHEFGDRSLFMGVGITNPHGDRKGPPDPTAPPSPLLYTSLATAASSWAWGLRPHMSTARTHTS